MRTIVANMVAGPGAGKSTLSYGLIAKLKSNGVRAELVTEFAKELTYRRDFAALANQFEVTREQDRRLRDLLGQVSVVVHDTALVLGLIYAQPPYTDEWNVRRTWELFDGYRNFNVFVTRTKKYQQYGRTQTEDESRQIDQRILDLFEGRVDLMVAGNEQAVDTVYQAILKKLADDVPTELHGN